MSATTLPGRLITVVRRKDRPAALLLPGAGGGLQPYLRLASFLGTTHNVYGVRAAGLVADEEPERSVAAMAQSALDAIDGGRVDPDVVFGWSLGGVVAWELCVRLAERGRRPALIVVDSSPLPRPSTTERDGGIRDVITRSLGGADDRARERVLATFQAQVDALVDYRTTSPYGGPVLALTCTGDEDEQPGGRVAALRRWRELAPHLVAGDLAAGHFAVFDPEHLTELTTRIATFLEARS